MTKRPFRRYERHPHLRIVQDDRLVHPAIERELRAREWVRRGCLAAATVSVLGISYLVALVVVAIAARWGR